MYVFAIQWELQFGAAEMDLLSGGASALFSRQDAAQFGNRNISK